MVSTKRPTPVDDDDDDDEADSEGSEVIGVESAPSNLRRDPVSLAIGYKNTYLTNTSGRKPDCLTKAPAMEQVEQPLK
ncbi:MAG: hypothetical protein Q9184_008089, partial [Pyrenodesmia sp. 2 TL-2023]